jgi:hypothetical protein
MPSSPEYQLHKQVAQYLAVALPDNCFFTTIGHGGGGRVRGAMLKGLHLVPGVPDILILFTGRAIFLELKTATGRLSESQKAVHNKITLCGHVVTTCRSLDEVIDRLIVFGIPLKDRIARAAA